MSNATIYEQGNGLPEAGDYCSGDGQLWFVVSVDSRIQTNGSQGNYVYATVSGADYSDCSEEDEHTARVVIETDSDDECSFHRAGGCGPCNYCEQ